MNFFWSYQEIQDFIKYGALYNWYAATDARKITSSDDWAIPTPAQWNVIPALFSNDYAATAQAMKETGTTYWIDNNGTNTTGFNGRGASFRNTTPLTTPTTSNWENIKSVVLFWSTSSPSYDTQSLLRLTSEGNSNDAHCYNWLENRSNGQSIRLLYVGAGTPTEYVGNDGKTYRIILIGSQYWLADNLYETKYRNGDWITGYDGGVYTPISDAAWGALTTEAMCFYNDDEGNG